MITASSHFLRATDFLKAWCPHAVANILAHSPRRHCDLLDFFALFPCLGKFGGVPPFLLPTLHQLVIPSSSDPEGVFFHVAIVVCGVLGGLLSRGSKGAPESITNLIDF